MQCDSNKIKKMRVACAADSDSLTWLILMSTSVLAAGWAISRSFMMVAPSLLMVTFLPSKMSLSIPRGPRVVRTASATAWQALMLLTSWALPCISEERIKMTEQWQKNVR